MQTIPRADAYPDFPPVEGESTTVTPTTTGTVGGEVYRLAGPAERAAQSGSLEMNPQDFQSSVDAATLLGLPTMKMEQLGMDELNQGLRKLASQEQAGIRRALRYSLRAANRVPDEGPQAIAERGEAIKTAAGVPASKAKYWGRLKDFAEKDTFEGIQQQLDDLHRGGWPKGTESWAEHEPNVHDPKIESVMDELGISEKGSKAKTLKNFTTRRELAKLGWKLEDVQDLPNHRIQDILNRNIENVGQGWKWHAIEAGKRDAEAVTRANKKELGQLGAFSDFVNFLRSHGGSIEPYANPLESTTPRAVDPNDPLDILP